MGRTITVELDIKVIEKRVATLMAKDNANVDEDGYITEVNWKDVEKCMPEAQKYVASLSDTEIVNSQWLVQDSHTDMTGFGWKVVS